jgi:hypothetical protein
MFKFIIIIIIILLILGVGIRNKQSNLVSINSDISVKNFSELEELLFVYGKEFLRKSLTIYFFYSYIYIVLALIPFYIGP